MLSITTLYAGLLGIMYIFLSLQVGSNRGRVGISLGAGGDEELQLASRRHGNFIEYVPFALLLMALLEVHDIGVLAMHVLGIVLLACRIFHAVGLNQEHLTNPLRVIGGLGTYLLILVMSVWAIVAYF